MGNEDLKIEHNKNMILQHKNIVKSALSDRQFSKL